MLSSLGVSVNPKNQPFFIGLKHTVHNTYCKIIKKQFKMNIITIIILAAVVYLYLTYIHRPLTGKPNKK